ncbi:MAG TPA: alpha/beta hydrolase [Burkholderiales bacterium]|nr:alpha/beta hydrolase [Burkholderiales bacterium]
MAIAYNPAGQFEIKVWDVDFRRAPGGRELKARVYQPQGAGPFPVVLDLHGGAWNDKDRLANVPMDRNLAESGILVVAIDMTLAPEAPYPASVQDANYGVRWLKARAREWKGDPATLGVLGSSTGGHMAELLAMRPRDPRYNAHPLPESPNMDATVNYVIARSPISDPYTRFQQAEKMKRAEMMQKTKNYFKPWESIFEANPQQMLERGEAVSLPPMFILQGELDDNVIPVIQQKFAATYRKAGGECQLEVFPGCGHMWVAEPGPQTDRAHEMIRAFIVRQLGQLRQAA